MLTYTKVRPILHVEVTASVLKPEKQPGVGCEDTFFLRASPACSLYNVHVMTCPRNSQNSGNPAWSQMHLGG